MNSGPVLHRVFFPLSISVKNLRTSSLLSVTAGHWWGPERAAGREVVGFAPLGEPVSFFLFVFGI